MELQGEMPDCLRRRYLGQEERAKASAPRRPAIKAERCGAFSLHGHRLLSLYRKSTLVPLTLILSYRPPSSCLKYLGGLGVKPPVGPVGQTAKDLT